MISVLNSPVGLFPTLFPLSDRGIRECLEGGRIKVDDFEDRQVQPASLDLRIGEVSVYDDDYRLLVAREVAGLDWRERMEYEASDKHAVKYPDEEDRIISIPSRAWTEIVPHERIETELWQRVDLRSSRGKLGLKIDSYQNGILNIMNYSPNTIKLYGRTPFAQMFFHDNVDSGGRIVVDEDEAQAIGEQLGVPTWGSYLLFRLGDSALRFRDVGVYDVKNPRDDLYEEVALDNLEIPPLEMIIAELDPSVKVPNDMAIQLIDVPYIQTGIQFGPDPMMLLCESMRSNAGLIDPGYEGSVTAHLMRTKFPGVYNKGDCAVLGVITKFNKDVLRGYGHPELGSHYGKKDGLVGSKS